MDKYEYKLKLDQMKSLTAEGKYEEAAEIADTINWRKRLQSGQRVLMRQKSIIRSLWRSHLMII